MHMQRWACCRDQIIDKTGIIDNQMVINSKKNRSRENEKNPESKPAGSESKKRYADSWPCRFNSEAKMTTGKTENRQKKKS